MLVYLVICGKEGNVLFEVARTRPLQSSSYILHWERTKSGQILVFIPE